MLFNSLSYAFFLPIVFGLYWLFPHRFRWCILLVASYYFYMSWNPKYVVLILATTVISYYAALCLERNADKLQRKIILSIAAVICLGFLFFFKYFEFFWDVLTDICGAFAINIHPITLKLILPVGISFYTFQTLSYVIDVYKGEAKAEHHFGTYATYISFFPQLVAGPIERTNNLLPQIKGKKSFEYNTAIYGARQMLWGYYKKIAIADVLAIYVDRVYDNLGECTSLDSLFAIIFFSLQIYCDFSGYSDIAIGTAKLFGINLMKNFDSPYLACSLREFWNRWHISLSTWFRDYVYIPMGGSRCSKSRNMLNTFITFLVSGLWHGANWTFIFWGGVHGTVLMLEKLFGIREEKTRVRKIIRWFLMFVFCNLAWVFFRAPSFNEALMVIRNLSCTNVFMEYFHNSIGLSVVELLYIVASVSIVAVFDIFNVRTDIIMQAGVTNGKGRMVVLLIEYSLLSIMLLALIHFCGTNQFVYFQF